jgi:hypothetical protein
MSALERIERLPDWPARMTAPVAAAYMGIGHATFLARYKDTGVREGANLLWARAQLDRLIQQQFGLEQTGTSAVAPLDDSYAAWKARGRR